MTSHNKISYDKTHFVSLVGEGASSTLVPYLGYLQRFGQPLSVSLLPSPHTAQWVGGLEAQIRELSPDVEIRVITVATGFEKGTVGYPKAEDVYQRLENQLGPLAVNMMAGMKRASIAGILALKGRRNIFLQLSDKSLIISRLADGTVRSETMDMKMVLPAKTLLDLQLIDYHLDPDPPRDLKRLCQEAGVPVPEDAIFEAVVGGHKIDCLWSADNNVLHILLIAQPRFRDSSEALASARRVEAMAGTKNWTNGLYSRKIIVLETEPRNVERYSLEMGGRVQPHEVVWRDDHLTESAKSVLREIFDPPKPPPPPVLHKPDLDLAAMPTLITSLSRLSDATLLAIAAHGRPQVVLLYTPEDEWVANMLEIFRAKLGALGVKNVVGLPTDFTAANVYAHLPPSLALHSIVNVTPGTKAQGTALGLWAKCCRSQAWALGPETVERIDGRVESRPIPPIGLKTRLDLTLEVPVTDYGWGARSQDFSDPFFDRIQKLMRLLVERGEEADFLKDSIELDGFKMVLIDSENRHWRFKWQADASGPEGYRDLKDGFWYEKLTAKAIYALNRLGRESYDVSCGVEVSPPGRPDLFLTERDVLVATSKSQLFMISCKTAGRFKSNVYKRILSEVEAMAKTLGRFTIPVLCDMTPNPPKMSGEVLVMGWTTLCRPERLHAALQRAALTRF